MRATNACPECGGRVPDDAPFGLCPRCLMNAASASVETATHRPARVWGDDEAPPASPALERADFLQAVLELGLVLRDELGRLASDPGQDVSQLSRALVEAKKLTAYQAGAILQGKARGLLIGDHLVREKIGVGGMGVVFKAVHRPSGRVVALKILPPSFGREAGAVRRFRREFQVASRLSHPNLVAAIEASEDRGVHYLTMEYIPGYDLDRLVARGGPMDLRLALHGVIQVARGLEAAHAQGVVHRDIKPGNIMIDPAGVVRVLDLGLARVIEATGGFGPTATGTLTRTGAYMGTVDFLAPEQADDAKTADGRADIYSLACTLYYLLSGRPPFPGDTVLQRLMAHQQRPAPSLRAARPEVPEALEALYHRMMAKRPANRPGTMSEVVLALEACRTTPREAGDVSVDLKTFARTVLKRAPERGRRGPDASVFARPSPESDGLAFDPDLKLEDLITDWRPEGGHDPIPEEKLPPIASRPRPQRPRRRRNSVPVGTIALLLIGFVAAGFLLRPRAATEHGGPASAPPTVAASPATVIASPRAAPVATVPTPPRSAFRPLFNGKDLAGWGGDVDDFEVLGGLLVCKPGRKGVIYEPVERGDFVARVEFRLAPGSEGGLLLRYPGRGDFAYDSMCEIQILDDSHPSYADADARCFHGSAWGIAAARRGHVRPPGQWNVQQVMVRGSTVRVELNGVVILDTDLGPIREYEKGRPHPGKDRTIGYFGLQSGIGTNQGHVEFRKVEIGDLPRIDERSPADG